MGLFFLKMAPKNQKYINNYLFRIKAMEKKQFREKYPNLAQEIDTGKSLVDIDFDEDEEKTERKYAGYDPSALDFIRRCKTKEQAEEIINYLEKRRELQKAEADELRKALKKSGLKAFGPAKGVSHYEKPVKKEAETEKEF